MGIFGPMKEFRERTFTMPCTPREAMSVIAVAEGLECARPFAQLLEAYNDAQQRGEPVGQPPLEARIYLESWGDHGMSIAAGNRVVTHWRMQLALSGANPVSGSFGATQLKNEIWPANVWSFSAALRRAVRSVGGKTGRWPGAF